MRGDVARSGVVASYTGVTARDRALRRRAQQLEDGEVIDFASDLLERSERRLRILDVMILVFAALSGVGVGYLFLRLFAPSFLEKLTIFGFVS
jgi:hypothetical protein